MNKVILLGRLTRDPDVRYSNGGSTVAKFSLAIDRRFKTEGGPTADFISCVAFAKTAEFAEKYLRQGTKIALEGRIQTGSYTNNDGVKIYTTDIVVEQMEFAESKATGSSNNQQSAPSAQSTGFDIGDGFMNIPDGIDEELPFA